MAIVLKMIFLFRNFKTEAKFTELVLIEIFFIDKFPLNSTVSEVEVFFLKSSPDIKASEELYRTVLQYLV